MQPVEKAPLRGTWPGSLGDVGGRPAWVTLVIPQPPGTHRRAPIEKDFAQQIVSELLEVNEQAFTIFMSAVADVTGPAQVAQALEQRLATAQGAGGHPMAIAILQRALKTLQAH